MEKSFKNSKLSKGLTIAMVIVILMAFSGCAKEEETPTKTTTAPTTPKPTTVTQPPTTTTTTTAAAPAPTPTPIPTYKPLSLDVADSIIHIPGDYDTIQQGIDAATDGDAVLVAPGTYHENIDFHGKSIILTSEAGPEDTTIDGDRAGTVVTFWSGEDTNSILHGFTVTNGLELQPGQLSPFPFGSGISIRDSSPTILQCHITWNACESAGGGIYVEGSQSAPVIENNVISHNFVSERGGGGISVTNGAAPIIKDNVIMENLAMEGSGIEVVNGSSPTIEGNNIINNVAGYDFDRDDCESYLNGVDVTRNVGHSLAIPGGILVVQNSSPTIRGNFITGNSGGGIGIILHSSPIVDNNIIQNNTGSIAGGIMVALESAPVIVHNTVERNEGTAIWVEKTSSVFDEQGSSISLGDGTFTSLQNRVSGAVVPWPLPLLEHEAPSSTRVLQVPEDFTTIQGAINSARDGDTVIVAQGIYRENVDFLGKRITVRSQDPDDETTVESTVIEAKELGPAIAFTSGETRDAILRGFTIRNRLAMGKHNAGIWIMNSSPTITQNTISDCSTTGIVINEPISPLTEFEASPLITDNIIKNNDGEGAGGISMCFASPEISGNVITDNEGGSGGVSTWFSSPVIVDNTITNNIAHGHGGGFFIDHYSQPVLRNNLISLNTTNGVGGGVYLDDFCQAVIDGNVISDNEAGVGGGIGMILDCQPVITNNVIASNMGGAIFINRSYPEVTNNTIAENFKEEGEEWGLFAMNNSTVFVTNTILFGNGIDLYDNHSEATVIHSLIFHDQGNSWPGKGNLSQDPLFVGDGDYHLLPSSPAIDAGVTVDLETDLDGNNRPQGQGFDIGAYEYVDHG